MFFYDFLLSSVHLVPENEIFKLFFFRPYLNYTSTLVTELAENNYYLRSTFGGLEKTLQLIILKTILQAQEKHLHHALILLLTI